MRRAVQKIIPSGLLAVGGSWAAARNATTASYTENIKNIENEYKSTRAPQVLANMRHYCEAEPVVDATKAMNSEAAVVICNAAVTCRANPAACPGLTAVCEWSISPSVAETLDALTISRICHACVALHAPLTFEVLTSHLWRVVELAPTMDAAILSVILNAYGRAGITHTVLYDTLTVQARKVLVRTNTAVTIANVANVSHAMARVGAFDKVVFEELADHAIRLQSKAVPLVIATVLDAFARCDVVDPVLFETYEQKAIEQLAHIPPPLVASLFQSLGMAKRVDSKLFTSLADRAMQNVAQFDAASVAKTLEAFRSCGTINEDLFGALAEHSCTIPQDFRLKEIRMTLKALSHFELYDAELFPLLSSRVVSLLRQKGGGSGSGSVDVEDVVGILSSFASVHERREDLVSYTMPLLSNHATAMNPTVLVEALWALDTLNVRADATKLLVATAAEKKVAIAQFVESKGDEQLSTRWAAVKKAFKLNEQ